LTVSNTSLAALELSSLADVGALSIVNNALLQTITCSALLESGLVSVTDNPLLTSVAFGFTGSADNLLFERNSGGADVTAVDIDLGAVRSFGTLRLHNNGNSGGAGADVWTIRGTAFVESFAMISARGSGRAVSDAVVVFTAFGSLESGGDLEFIGHAVDTTGIVDFGPATTFGAVELQDASRDVDFSFAAFLHVESMASLTIGADRLSSLAGLEALRTVGDLNITGSEIADYTPLTGLTSLRRFNFEGNTTNGTFPAIAGVATLESLSIGLNNVFASDTPFPALTTLGTLRIDNNNTVGNGLRFPLLSTSILEVEVSNCDLPLLDFGGVGVESVVLRTVVASDGFPSALEAPAVFRGKIVRFVLDRVSGVRVLDLQRYGGRTINELVLNALGNLTEVTLPAQLDVSLRLEVTTNLGYCTTGLGNAGVLDTWESTLLQAPPTFIVVGNCDLA